MTKLTVRTTMVFKRGPGYTVQAVRRNQRHAEQWFACDCSPRMTFEEQNKEYSYNMEEQNAREYYLKDILAAKHYPQVLRLTRPYCIEGREFLKKGQYITVLERRRIELLTGTAKEKRPFKVRKDRSAIVEVVEEDRIAHSLAEVAGVSNHIQGIEICKELRIEKTTFTVGERLTIEKIGKSFRGRMKSINLLREKDGKSFKLSLDVIGSFKLIAGKTKLPITKLMNLRTLPLSAQFRNTPTSSNFPSGTVTVHEMMLCDIVYILTVQDETYTYEAFSIESNIYVEKCNLVVPKPILKLVPNGMYVNSSDFLPMKQRYKDKIADIDSKLIENIYAPGYYGSATYEKPRLLDDHLVDMSYRKRLSTTLSLDETYDHAMRTLSEYSSNASTPDSEISATFPSKKPPDVLPRHSKNRQKEKRNTMTAIHEFDWSQQNRIPKSASESNIMNNDTVTSTTTTTSNNHYRHSSSSSAEHAVDNRSEADCAGLDLPSNVGTGSNRSTCSQRSRLSDRFENHPNTMYTPLDDHEVYYQPSPGKDRLVGRIYEIPNGPITRLHSRSSSIATEDSGDSGVVLNFHSSPPFYQGKNPSQQTTPEEENLYTIPHKSDPHPSTNVRKIILPAPAPSYSSKSGSGGEASVHKVHVDIDISGDVNNNNMTSSEIPQVTNLKSSHRNSPAVEQQSPPPPLQPRKPRQVQPTHEQDDYVNSAFVNETVGKRVKEIRGLTQDQTGVLLKCLSLARYVPIFSSELINGDLLLDLEEGTLIRDLGMTHFDARKLFKYVHGWRPVLSYADDSDVNSDPVCWSVNTVVNELLRVKLPVLARFCKDNHVDGSLLVDAVQSKIIESLKPEHNIAISGIELSRLRAFVLKKWRPDAAQVEKTRRISQQERSFSLSQNNNSGSNQNLRASRERVNSGDKKRTNSLWTRIKAV